MIQTETTSTSRWDQVLTSLPSTLTATALSPPSLVEEEEVDYLLLMTLATSLALPLAMLVGES